LLGAIVEARVCGVPVVASDIKPNLELGSFFSNIKCISLQESPSMWVSDIIDILRYKKKCYSLDYFLTTPFTIEKFCESYKRILISASEEGGKNSKRNI